MCLFSVLYLGPNLECGGGSALVEPGLRTFASEGGRFFVAVPAWHDVLFEQKREGSSLVRPAAARLLLEQVVRGGLDPQNFPPALSLSARS